MTMRSRRCCFSIHETMWSKNLANEEEFFVLKLIRNSQYLVPMFFWNARYLSTPSFCLTFRRIWEILLLLPEKDPGAKNYKLASFTKLRAAFSCSNNSLGITDVFLLGESKSQWSSPCQLVSPDDFFPAAVLMKLCVYFIFTLLLAHSCRCLMGVPSDWYDDCDGVSWKFITRES